MKPTTLTGLVIAAALAGYLVARRTAPASTAAASAATAPLPSSTVPAPSPLDMAALRDELRSEIRRAMRDVAPSREAEPAPEVQPPDAEEESPPEPTRAFEDASDVVDAASLRGRWTENDAATFRDLLTAMTPAERLDSMRTLATAINADRLRLETRGRPF
jgi:hypothetical protein